MRTIITKEIEVITCDICGKETDIITKCRVCGKDICNNCRMWDQCGECWKDNCSFATINKEAFNTINHESKEKWKDLLSRFHGKRVKIIIEEFPKYEEPIGITDFDLSPLQKMIHKFEAVDGDNTKEWLEKCVSLGVK